MIVYVNNKEVLMALGDRIKEHRERHGWTLRELARLAAVDAAWIQRLESGQRHNISLDAAKRVALVLGVSLDYLAGIIDRPYASGSSHEMRHRTKVPQERDDVPAAVESIGV
jgi:transcriptional regulator with XRE-family HTH domain